LTILTVWSAWLSRFVGPGYHHPTLLAKITTSPPQGMRVKERKIKAKLGVNASKRTSKNIANHDEILPLLH
jgi:hypothetical protein